jgi:hypothetical protein
MRPVGWGPGSPLPFLHLRNRGRQSADRRWCGTPHPWSVSRWDPSPEAPEMNRPHDARPARLSALHRGVLSASDRAFRRSHWRLRPSASSWRGRSAQADLRTPPECRDLRGLARGRRASRTPRSGAGHRDSAVGGLFPVRPASRRLATTPLWWTRLERRMNGLKSNVKGHSPYPNTDPPPQSRCGVSRHENCA